MATHGRYARLCEALTCFLWQTYHDRELVILNNHPVPLHFDHPLVRIYNEPKYPTLGHCRQRLLELAGGNLIRTWDDDDLYLPWAVLQGVGYINAAGNECDSWKPARSWYLNSRDPGNWRLADNTMEASITFRKASVEKVGYKLSGGDEHLPLITELAQVIGAVGWFASYGYRWGWGEWHISGSLGSSNTEDRTRTWQKYNHDVRPDVPLVPADLTEILEKWATKIPPLDRSIWRQQCSLPSSRLSLSPETV